MMGEKMQISSRGGFILFFWIIGSILVSIPRVDQKIFAGEKRPPTEQEIKQVVMYAQQNGVIMHPDSVIDQEIREYILPQTRFTVPGSRDHFCISDLICKRRVDGFKTCMVRPEETPLSYQETVMQFILGSIVCYQHISVMDGSELRTCFQL